MIQDFRLSGKKIIIIKSLHRNTLFILLAQVNKLINKLAKSKDLENLVPS